MKREDVIRRIDYIAMCSGGAPTQEKELVAEFDRMAAEIELLTKECEFHAKHGKLLADLLDTTRQQLTSQLADAKADVERLTRQWQAVETVVLRQDEQIAAMREGLEQIVSVHDMYCENHIGISKHSHDLSDMARATLAKLDGDA